MIAYNIISTDHIHSPTDASKLKILISARSGMTIQKKTSRAVKGQKYFFLRLTKPEIDDIVVGLNLYLDNEVGLLRGTELRMWSNVPRKAGTFFTS